MPRRVDVGFVTPAFVAAVGLTLLLLVMMTNLIAVHYARGVMQSGVEEGARQAVAAGSGACEARVQAAVQTGLGAMAEGVAAPVCAVSSDGAVVELSATFAPWLPILPAQAVDVRARAASRPAGP